MKNLLKFVAALLLLASSAHAQSTWNGNANDGIWGTSGNWLGGTPGANTDAIIPAGLVGKPYPTVDFSANCRTLTIQGGSLTINSDADLTINLSTAGVTALSNSGLLTVNGLLAVSGNVVNNGTIVGGPVTATNPNDGLVQFDNTATATLSGTGTTSLTNVTFSATSNMVFATNNKVNIGRIVRLRGRNWATGDKVLLTSSASTTGTSGMVDDAQAGSTITGNISVERAINGSFNSNDGYRHYSTPVRQPKFSDMAVTGVAPAAFTPRINSTYAYPATTNLTPFPNIFYFDESLIPATVPAAYSGFEYGWRCPASPADTFRTTRGYTVQINAAAKVTLTGRANTGTYATPLLSRGGNTGNSGWHLVGNPYPSPISVTKTMQDLNNVYDNMYNPNGFDPTVWFFRSAAPTPATSTAPAVINNGAYQWINTSTGATNMPAGTITRFFPVMQGFFVRKINAVPKAFIFRNSHRETTYPTSPKLTPFYRSSTPAALAAPAAVQLGLTLTDATTEVADLAFVGFRAGANAGTDILWDVVRPGDNTEAPTLFTRNAANDDCAYNALPLPAATTITLPLAAHTLRAGQPYRLTVSENTLPAGMRVYLEDRQNGKTRELTTRSAFTFTAEANASDHRFFLRFEPAGAAVSAPAPNVEVYPNPTTRNSALVISANKLGGTTATATLLNAFGQTVAVREVPVREGLLDAALATTGLPAGVYVLRVATATGVSSQRVEIR